MSNDPIKATFDTSVTFSKSIENATFGIHHNLMNVNIYQSDAAMNSDKGPARIGFLNSSFSQEKIDSLNYSYIKMGERHNDNGSPVDYIGDYVYREKTDSYFYTMTDIYKVFGTLHRSNGPAYIKRGIDLLTGKVRTIEEDFHVFAKKYTKDEFDQMHLSPEELKYLEDLSQKVDSIIDQHPADFFDWPEDLPTLPNEFINRVQLSPTLIHIPIIYQNSAKRKLIKYGYKADNGKLISHTIDTNKMSEVRVVGSGDDVKVLLKYEQHGFLHKVDGPAHIVCKTHADDKRLADAVKIKEEYHQFGLMHHEDGPAVIHRFYSNRLKLQEYRQYGLLHHEDGPARIKYRDDESNSIKMVEFHYNGQSHRLDGPAIIKYNPDGTIKEERWFLYNREINEKFLDEYGIYSIKNLYADLGYKIPNALIKHLESFEIYIGEPDKFQSELENSSLELL